MAEFFGRALVGENVAESSKRVLGLSTHTQGIIIKINYYNNENVIILADRLKVFQAENQYVNNGYILLSKRKNVSRKGQGCPCVHCPLFCVQE